MAGREDARLETCPVTQFCNGFRPVATGSPALVPEAPQVVPFGLPLQVDKPGDIEPVGATPFVIFVKVPRDRCICPELVVVVHDIPAHLVVVVPHPIGKPRRPGLQQDPDRGHGRGTEEDHPGLKDVLLPRLRIDHAHPGGPFELLVIEDLINY